MEITKKQTVGVWTTGLALGAAGDFLLHNAGLGINVPIFALLLAITALFLKRHYQIAFTGNSLWLTIPAALTACGFAVRDSPTLLGLDGLALGTSLLLGAFYSRTGQMARQSLSDYLRALRRAGAETLWGGIGLVTKEIPWTLLREGAARSRRSLAVARGLVLSLPLLLVFGGLFAAADPVFAHYAALPFRWDMATLGTHLVGTLLGAWMAGGFLRYLLRDVTQAEEDEAAPPRFSLGPVETSIILGMLDALFLAFVLVQVRYFFGGRTEIQAVAGMTYAAYARHGFFELVTVAGLSLPLLLALDSYWRRETAAQERTFRTLAAVLLVLLSLIMASALGRMALYRSEYGLTELRVYTTAFMGWLAVVFAWFATTVLRGERPRFAAGALTAGFVAIAALHGYNPDAQIVRTNATLSKMGRAFDACYATSLSADSVPALVAALPSLRPAEQRIVAARLLRLWRVPQHQDWRAWRGSKAVAWVSLQSHRPQITALGGTVVGDPCAESPID